MVNRSPFGCRSVFAAAVILSACVIPLPAQAFTLDTTNRIATTDGSQADVQNAVNSGTVTSGWTVTIPSGSFTWGSTVTINKGITLQGAGSANTTIGGSAAPRIHLTKQSSQIVRVSAMTFASGTTQSIWVDGPSSGRPFIVNDCVFNLNNGQALLVQTNGGLIYNCTFNGSWNFNDEAVQHKQPQDNVSWFTPDTLGMHDSTGERNLYIEDCTFNSLRLQGFDFDDASRIVIRHSTFVNSAITSHGADTSPQGVRHFEIYNNTFSYTFAYNDASAQDVGYFMFIRGGTGVIADNSIDNIQSQQWGDKAEILLTVYNITRNGGQVPCQTRYPAFHQIGQGYNGSSFFTDGLWISGNTGGGNYANPGIEQYSPDQCGTGQVISNYLQVNRDYFVNSPKSGYTKYTYPHPLRSSTSTPPPTPSAPTNLRVIG